MLINKLKSMSRDELKEFARSQGVQHHHKATADNILKAIVEQIGQQPKPQRRADETPEEKIERIKAERTVHHTQEDVEAILLKNKEKQPALTWEFYDDHSVTVRCKGAETSFNLDIPAKTIQRQLDLHVMRGRLALMGLNPHFDSMNSASGKNAYTNTVLA